jgi:8-oxo-dGTP pyrophosphatase MutT (NUDIX family)
MMTYDDLKLPISVKAVIIKNDEVILLKNDRDEWELPGGRLEDGETPETCLTREVSEELNAPIVVGALLDAWIYQVAGKQVFILVYQARLAEENQRLEISDEHQDVGLFGPDHLSALNLPEGYRVSIVKSGFGRRAA